MSLYSNTGAINVTVVTGDTYTGLYAADGSYNVVIAPTTGYVGLYHPCGAYYVTVATTETSRMAPNGSMYVTTNSALTGPMFVRPTNGGLYVLPTPILLESFDSATGFSASNGGVLEVDTVNKIQGTGSLGVTSTQTFGPQVTKTDIGTYDPADLGTIAYFAYFGEDPEYQTCTQTDARLGRSGTYYNQSGVTNSSVSNSILGGKWDAYHVSEVGDTLENLGEGQLGVRVVIGISEPKCENVRLDALLGNAAGRPTVILTFDDIKDTQYSIAYPLMKERGFKGTCYIPPTEIVENDTMTLEQLQELNSEGWAMCCDGTMDDSTMTSKATVADAITDIQNVQQYLINNNLSVNDSHKHLCFPNGSVSIPGTEVQIASVTGDGTTSVTGTFTGVTDGMKVAGRTVPADTFVVSGQGTGTLVLSNSIPTGTTAMSFTDTSGEFHTHKLRTALKNAGFLTARTTQPGTFYSRFGVADRGLNLPGVSSTDVTPATLLEDVDEAILRGTTVIFYFHMFGEVGSGLTYATADFETFLDALKTRVDNNQLDVMTITEWWARDGNATLTL